MPRLVTLRFPGKDGAELWLMQIDNMNMLIAVDNACEKEAKCGRSTEIRLKNDVKAGLPLAFVKQAGAGIRKCSRWARRRKHQSLQSQTDRFRHTTCRP